MELFIYVIIFIFGLIIGSFLNVVIYRVPKNESILFPASHCPNCGHKLKPWHNIPLISWLFLKGKCAFCSQKISIRYPVIELFTGIMAILIYWKIHKIDIFTITVFASFATLLALSIIDLDYKAVPDSLNLLALTFAFFTSPDILTNFKNALIMMGGMEALRVYVSYFLKREAMGEGDVIVAGTMGALLGIKLTLIALFLSAVFALIPSVYLRISKKEYELPYIPFLALATFCVWLFSPWFNMIWSYIYG
jgi:leader peptidase (prepilin peptidase)/N-methyltransferase